MFFSLGYADELLQAAERGSADTRASITVDRDALRRVAAAAFPDVGTVSIAAEPLAGDGGVSYVVTTTDPDREAVVKVAPSDAAPTLRTGVHVYEHLTTVPNVPVPDVYAIDTSEERLSYPYSVVEHVGGDELDEVAAFVSLPTERKRTLVRAMGRTLGELHERTTFDRYGSLSADDEGLTAGGERDWASFYTDHYREHADGETDSPVADLADGALAFFERAAAELAGPPAPALLHGDYTPDNFVIRDGGVHAVLDWEHATAGDPAWEAWKLTENVVNLHGEDEGQTAAREALREGYHSAMAATDAFRARKAVFAVGEFARIAGVRRVLANTVEAFDDGAFRRRAEAEFEERRERADARLKEVR